MYNTVVRVLYCSYWKLSQKDTEVIAMTTPTITIRIDNDDKELIAEYARTFGLSLSDFIRETVLERIESELDLKAWDAAKAEYDADPVSYSAEDIANKFL